jgi:hypothetical protein
MVPAVARRARSVLKEYLAFAALAAAGCSLTFDAEAPEVTLVGPPAPPLTGPRVVRAADERFYLAQAPDGATWAVLYRLASTLERNELPVGPFVSQPLPVPGGGLQLTSLRVARLDPPAFEATADSNDAQLAFGTLLVRHLTTTPGERTLIDAWRPGDPWPGATLDVPPGSSTTWLAERALAYSVPGPTIETWRLDGSFHRVLPRPKQANFLAARGDVLIGADNCASAPPPGRLCAHAVAHRTDAERDVDLGEISFANLALLDDGALTCGDDGVRRMPFDGTPPRLLDKPACDGSLLLIGDRLLACGKEGLRSIAVDGSGADVIDPAACTGGLRALADFHAGTIVCAGPGLLVLPHDGAAPRIVDRARYGDGTAACGINGQVAVLADQVLECGQGVGLRRVPYDGSGATTLDTACAALWRYGGARRDVWYTRAPLFPVAGEPLTTDLWAAALDGASGPRVALPADPNLRLLTRSFALDTPDPIFTRDPPDRYRQGSDGWLHDWQFMVRGILPTTSSDGKELRWLENAARLLPVGDLDSAPLPRGPILHLARNVGQYLEVSPGKLLVADDQALIGAQNRLILIDEAARTATRVASSADRFYLFDAPDGSRRMLVEVVDDAGITSLTLAPAP